MEKDYWWIVEGKHEHSIAFRNKKEAIEYADKINSTTIYSCSVIWVKHKTWSE